MGAPDRGPRDTQRLTSRKRGLQAQPVRRLVVDAEGRILVTTPDGPQISTDRGASFDPLSDAPNLYPIAASPDRQQVIGVDNKGIFWSSMTDARRWRNVGTVLGSAQAITITDTGDILVVDDSGLSLLPST